MKPDVKGNAKNSRNRVLIQIADFLRREIPIRLAHRIHDLDSSLFFREMPSVQEVRELCVKSFIAFHECQPITDMEGEKVFAKMLLTEFDRHSNVLMQMA